MTKLKSSSNARKALPATDPALAEMFAESPTTARRSYQRNVDDLIADLDAAAARTRARRSTVPTVAAGFKPDKPVPLNLTVHTADRKSDRSYEVTIDTFKGVAGPLVQKALSKMERVSVVPKKKSTPKKRVKSVR